MEKIKSNYKHKILDNKENEVLLNKLINNQRGKLMLIDAECGSGKTYAINKIFNNQKEKYMLTMKGGNSSTKQEDYLNVLLCPTRVQNLQNENYDLRCIIRESKYFLEKTSPFRWFSNILTGF